MALIYSPSLSSLFLSRGILDATSGQSPTVVFYGGAKPTCAEYYANFATSYRVANSNYLALANPILGFVQPYTLVGMTGNPGNLLPVRSGTVSWGVMFHNQLSTDGHFTNNAVPVSNRFMIFEVTDPSGTSPVRISTTNLVLGTPFQITDIGFTAQMV